MRDVGICRQEAPGRFNQLRDLRIDIYSPLRL